MTARAKCTKGRTNPALWERSKAKAIKRLGGRFSARAMQLAGKLYRDAGGGYCGPKTKAQKSMSKWTAEDWKTAPGAVKKACKRERSGTVVCDRYLPAKAWASLTPAQRQATRRKKQGATDQWVSNTKAAKKAGRQARRK
jgi:hypothetical protein